MGAGCCSHQIHTDALPALPAGIVHLTTQTDRQIVDRSCELTSLAFAGTTTTAPEAALSWCLDPKASGDDPCSPLLENPSEARARHFKFLVDWQVHSVALRQGGCFSIVESGQVMAALIAYPPGAVHEPGFCRAVSTAMFKTGDAPETMKSGVSHKRLQALGKEMEASHKKFAPDPHWYVQFFATDVSSQGKGYGQRLLAFVAALGDKSNCPVYLECCGERSERFYAKQGFRTVHRIRVEDAEAFPGDVFDKMAVMVRAPLSKW